MTHPTTNNAGPATAAEAGAPALRRQPRWASRLQAVIDDRRHRPFTWGKLDCCLWAADAVHATTGADLAAEWRGRYASRTEARALLAQLGGLPALAARAGPEIAPAQAAMGDVGLVQVPGETGPGCLAVHDGQHWLAPGPLGLVPHPPALATRAWRVGGAGRSSRPP